MPDYNKTIQDDLVHLARLALVGRPQDVRTYVGRIGRRYQSFSPTLADRLARLAADHPTPAQPVRGATVAAIPVDLDSRLGLVRFDPAPGVDHPPVWCPAVADQLAAILAEHHRSHELVSAGLAPCRTAIFTGPPGVGKTMAAHWLAARLDVPLLTLDLSAAVSSYLGRSGANVRHVMDYAKGLRCVLLLDEIDAIAKRRDDAHELGELKRLVTVLLQAIDDWPAGSLLLAATNHAGLLDPAIWRRFERRLEFPLPDAIAAGRLAAELVPSLGERWADAIGQVYAGRSFADLSRDVALTRKAAILSGRDLAQVLPEMIRAAGLSLGRTARKRLAVSLTAAGLSARAAHDLTGVSRDTLRRAKTANSQEAT